MARTKVSDLIDNRDLTAIDMLREMIGKIECGQWRVDTFVMNQSEWGTMEVRIQVSPGRDAPSRSPYPLESPDPLADAVISEQWVKAQAVSAQMQAAFERGQDLRFAQGSVAAPEFGTVAEYDRDEWAVDPSTGETYRLPPGYKQENGYIKSRVSVLNDTVRAERKATRARAREAAKPPKPATPAGASPARDLDL